VSGKRAWPYELPLAIQFMSRPEDLDLGLSHAREVTLLTATRARAQGNGVRCSLLALRLRMYVVLACELCRCGGKLSVLGDEVRLNCMPGVGRRSFVHSRTLRGNQLENIYLMLDKS
jgi:hypothetical protein